MPFHAEHAEPLGEWIDDGLHKPFRATDHPIRAMDYDESQMKESDAESRAQRGDLLYEC